MTDNLLSKVPSSIAAVPEALAAWEELAKMVQDDSNPVVTLPGEDARDLTLVTTLGGADIVTNEDGTRTVTLKVEEASIDESDEGSVKEAATAESKFAGRRRSSERRR